MEKYWKAHPAASPTPPAASTSGVAQPNEASILSEYDRHCLVLLSSQNEDEGWQPEMRRYLKDLPADVTKDTDIVKWWQVCICIINWDQQCQLMIFIEQWGTLSHPPSHRTWLPSLSSFVGPLRMSFFCWGRSCDKTTSSTWRSAVWRAADDEVRLEEQHRGPCSMELSTGGRDR